MDGSDITSENIRCFKKNYNFEATCLGRTWFHPDPINPRTGVVQETTSESLEVVSSYLAATGAVNKRRTEGSPIRPIRARCDMLGGIVKRVIFSILLHRSVWFKYVDMERDLELTRSLACPCGVMPWGNPPLRNAYGAAAATGSC